MLQKRRNNFLGKPKIISDHADKNQSKIQFINDKIAQRSCEYTGKEYLILKQYTLRLAMALSYPAELFIKTAQIPKG